MNIIETAAVSSVQASIINACGSLHTRTIVQSRSDTRMTRYCLAAAGGAMMLWLCNGNCYHKVHETAKVRGAQRGYR